jgi:lipoate-protein ligase A
MIQTVSTRCKAMEWWLAQGGDPVQDLAREELLLRAASETARPLGFICRWSRPVLVLGYAQGASTVDLAACRRLGVPVLRRATGGTGVLYDGDLALSLALPAEHPWAATIGGLYDAFVESIRSNLAEMGVSTERGTGRAPAGERSPICFEDHLAETLARSGRKLLGCAQVRRREAVLVHGALLLGVNTTLQAQIYGVSPARIEEILGRVPSEAYSSPEALARSLAEGLASRLGGGPVEFSPPPALTDALVTRTSDPKWVIA